MSASVDDEWFEYPLSWAEAYAKKRGNLRYFPQYALMELLRQRYGIKSLTWLHLASVDRKTKSRLAAQERWAPASPSPSLDPRRTALRKAHWDTMRRQMGQDFEVLQEAIVRAKFIGAYQGEPDLFCWVPGGWFFAEAKRPGEKILQSQRKWWRVATALPGINCRVFTCRLVQEGTLKQGQSAHTARWTRMADSMRIKPRRSLGSAEAFVNKVLGERRRA